VKATRASVGQATAAVCCVDSLVDWCCFAAEFVSEILISSAIHLIMVGHSLTQGVYVRLTLASARRCVFHAVASCGSV